MKFRAMTFMLAILGLAVLSSKAFAEQEEDFSYLESDRAITITGYTGSEDAVIIPALIQNKPVLRIGERAFAEDSSITAIVIPYGVTVIDDEAFSACTGLVSAYFLGSAPSMGSDVFDSTTPDFTVYYAAGTTGFTSPLWQGYPSEIFNPASLAMNMPDQDILDSAPDRERSKNIILRELIILYLLRQSRELR